jgi:hypothetical protein
MNKEQIAEAERMRIKYEMARVNTKPKPEASWLEVRARQQRMIAQQLLNVVDDAGVVNQVHKILFNAYARQMDLVKKDKNK